MSSVNTVDPRQSATRECLIKKLATNPSKAPLMSLFTIRLSLARSPDSPNGDPAHYYEFRAPLDSTGHLDRKQWPQTRQFCLVTKHERGAATQQGLLLNTGSGKWVFSYERGDADDESIFRLASHVFIPDEYISITEHDGVQRTFHVDSVQPWHVGSEDGVKAARWPSART